MRNCIGAFLGVCFLGLLVVGGCIAVVGMTGNAIVESQQRVEREEQERLAAMSPEERAAEERQKAKDADKRASEEADRDRVTMANYLKIETGMTEAQVAEIMGGHGEEQSSNRIGQGTQFDTYTRLVAWTGFLKSITVTYQNGKVAQKAQFGLK